MGFSLFPSFFDRPTKIRFETQEEDEQIELFLRQHFVTNVPWIFVSLIGVFLPFLLFGQSQVLDFIGTFNIPPEVIFSIVALWYLFLLAYVINNILYWYFNIYIVTNKHLVDISLQNLLSRSITEVRLDDVQSASTSIKGIIRSLFNFGDVVIESAAKKQTIQFLAVPKPDFVTDRIQDLQEIQEGPSTTLRASNDVS